MKKTRINIPTETVKQESGQLYYSTPDSVKNHKLKTDGMSPTQGNSVVFEHSRNSTMRFVVEVTKPPIKDRVEFRCFNNSEVEYIFTLICQKHSELKQ